MLLLVQVVECLIGVAYICICDLNFPTLPTLPLFLLDGRLPTVISCLTKDEHLDHRTSPSLEKPYGMNLNRFEVSLSSLHIRGVWVFTHEQFMLSSLLGVRRPFLCSRVFCSIFRFHFWFHKGMFWSRLESKNHHASRDRTPFWICPSSSAYSRLCTTPPNISTPWLWTGRLVGEGEKKCLIQM